MILDLVYRAIKGTRLSKEEGDANLLALAQALQFLTAHRIHQLNAAVIRSSLNSISGTIGDDDYYTMTSIIIPAGTMRLNGRIQVEATWNYQSSAVTKSFATYFGGSLVGLSTATTSNGFEARTNIKNLNSASIQGTHNTHTFGSAGAPLSTTIDTTNDVALDLECKWSGATLSETITLAALSVFHYPGNS